MSVQQKKIVHVAVGVIKRNDAIFICKRPEDKHQGGKWEFPGGKVEAAETVTQVGLVVRCSTPFMEIHHDYGDKAVFLDVHLVEDFSGEAKGLEGQQGLWVDVHELQNYQFPEANQVILDKLLAE